ncbi:NifB/NifX family molybdenum-iron cluster-binding protein [Treponema sp.]|uniref:NifB/NifX family molybdenum-iron cluster-binding protein n=1 Tax=Treponema sp. TaxID=166 RepID=UPI003F10127A
MLYKIAVATSSGENVDLKFGEAQEFSLYAAEGKKYSFLEKRAVEKSADSEKPESCSSEICGSGNSCGGNGHGCAGAEADSRVVLLSDCRCVVCKKIGFHAQRQFEKKAISVFDVECSIKEALDKITAYYEKTERLIRIPEEE